MFNVDNLCPFIYIADMNKIYDYEKSKLLLKNIYKLNQLVQKTKDEYLALNSVFKEIFFQKFNAIYHSLLIRREEIASLFEPKGEVKDSEEYDYQSETSFHWLYSWKYKLESLDIIWDDETKIHNIKKDILDSFNDDYSQYMMYLYYSVATFFTIRKILGGKNGKFLKKIEYIDREENYTTDYLKTLLYFSKEEHTSSNYDSIERLMLFQKHIIREIDYDKECDNFIDFLKKTQLEFNLSNV